MKDFDFEMRIDRIKSLEKDQQIKFIFMWVKQGVINTKQFAILVTYIK